MKNVWQNIATLYSLKHSCAQLCEKLDDCVLHQATIMDFPIKMKIVLVYQMPHFQQHARRNHEHVATHGCLVIVYVLLKMPCAWAVWRSSLSQLVHFCLDQLFLQPHFLHLSELSKHEKSISAMSGGMKNVKRPSQRKILPEINAYKQEPEQTKNNIHKQEKKLLRSAKRKRSNG